LLAFAIFIAFVLSLRHQPHNQLIELTPIGAAHRQRSCWRFLVFLIVPVRPRLRLRQRFALFALDAAAVVERIGEHVGRYPPAAVRAVVICHAGNS
jgi:hypothetical protein